MYIKWIVCQVKKDKKQQFSLAQDRWIKTVEADGFIAQVGGWDLKNNSEACIISFWNSEEQLEHFMDNLHDKIFDKNRQADTYNSINISHFVDRHNIKVEFDLLRNAIKMGTSLSVADCYLKSEKSVHFEKVLKEIWTPGMKRSEGVLGGLFAKSSNNNLRFLVSTFWNSIKNHNNYVLNMSPIYSNKATISNDMTKMKERVIILVDSWKIIK